MTPPTLRLLTKDGPVEIRDLLRTPGSAALRRLLVRFRRRAVIKSSRKRGA